ncbi:MULTISPECIES: aspartyl protease family protein [Alistipes]|jgi:hypothetical protein|uniref:aspartyl protease family protein n=1 Tax=Alistipes TaxID=239759 RepID=UPI001459C90A|nr:MULTISPECIES: aspartyl protease family protein [Alistipes]MBK1777312.1 aspartyl protease family protein [Escherichia coli]MBL1049530.1 aspartyl protease family protein [Escherichia coli]MBS5476092.1 aspartyl protease family protein [Alistipes sp.]MCI7592520.1 aspartyl protease family protein [Alistipes shahii]MCO7105294.1 aspartyl protease family protein [Alistipes shahii]
MIIPLRFSLSKIGLPVILIKAQAKNLCLLLDTGSNINILDRRVAEFFQLSASPIRQKQFGIDGTLQTSAVVELAFSLEEREYKADFSVMDLSSAFGKVEEESGIQIHGLLGCSFMEQQKWVLDFENLTLCLPS